MMDKLEMRYVELVAENARLRAALDEARKFTVLQAAWGASNDHELNKSATDLLATIDKAMGER
jgi:hypothetical protein